MPPVALFPTRSVRDLSLLELPLTTHVNSPSILTPSVVSTDFTPLPPSLATPCRPLKPTRCLPTPRPDILLAVLMVPLDMVKPNLQCLPPCTVLVPPALEDTLLVMDKTPTQVLLVPTMLTHLLPDTVLQVLPA